MATTKNGIYYQNDYNQIADVLEDSKKMAESIDKIFDDEEIKYDKKMSLLQQENEQLKSQIPTGQSTGEEITLNDSSNLPFKELKIMGNSFQETREVENLIDINTLQDGYVNLSGKITNDTSQGEKHSDFIKVIPNTKYRFVILKTTDEFPTWFAVGYYTSNNEESFIKRDHFSESGMTSWEFTTSENAEYIRLSARNLTNATEILLENTELDAKPSPDNPSEIRNCGDNVNLLDLNSCTFLYCKKQEDNSIKSNVQNGYMCIVRQNNINNILMKNRGKKLSFFIDKRIEGKSISIIIRGTRSSGTNIQEVTRTNSKEVTIEIAKDFTDITNIELRFNRSDVIFLDTETVVKDLQLKLKTQATPYSPYNCGNVNFKVCNKNLSPELVTGWLNTSTGILDTSYNQYKSTVDFVFQKANTQKKIIRYDENTGIRIYYYEIDGTFITSNVDSKAKTRNTTIYDRDVLIKYMLLNTTPDEDIKTMVCEVNLDDDYIPHEEQSISFPTKEGQVLHKGDYLADNGVHHKKVTIEVEGADDENWKEGDSTGDKRMMLNNIPKPKYSGVTSLLSTHFKSVQNLHFGNCFITGDKSGIHLGNMIDGNKKWENVDALKQFLKEQKANGTPVKFEYELEEEIIEPYSTEQQEAYDKIKEATSYKNVTHIFSEDEISPEFEVTYYKDLETLLNNKTASVSNEVQQEAHSEMTNEEPSMEDSVGGEE